MFEFQLLYLSPEYMEKKMKKKLFLIIVQIIVGLQIALAGTKSQPHPHQGKLQPYDGKHIPYRISLEENAKLEDGKPVR